VIPKSRPALNKMMKKGLLGCNLLNQVIVIGVAYCVLSLMGIVFGFLLVAHPEKFSGVTQTQQDTMQLPRGVSEFNSSVEDDQRAIVEESRTASKDIEEDEEVSGEEDLMYRDEVFGEDGAENGDETEDEKGNLSAEEAFDVEEQQQGREVMREAEDEKDLLEEDIEVPQSAEKEEENLRLRQLIKHIEGDGVEVLIESALSLTCSLILLHGVRTNRHWLLLPWLLDTMMEMVAGFLQVTVQAAREQWTMSTTHILGVLLFYFLGGYCLYSVASYQVLLRRMNKNSDQIINSVCQAGGFQDLVGGRNYRRLEEEVWQSEPNLGEELQRAHQPQHGFSREKKVEDERPDQDEHVLYVQC